MNISQNSVLLQRLAADYALGIMRGPARRRFETLAKHQAAIRLAISEWQGRFTGLTEVQTPVAPSAVVWRRIEISLHLEREARRLSLVRQIRQPSLRSDDPWWRQLFVWQGATAAALMMALVALVGPWHLESEKSTLARRDGSFQLTPKADYVAMLLDGENKPTWLISVDGTTEKLQLQKLKDLEVPAGHSLQLWAVPASGAPRSLSVLASNASSISVATAKLEGATLLAFSLEVEGGVPESGGPQGPVVFKGPLVRKSA